MCWLTAAVCQHRMPLSRVGAVGAREDAANACCVNGFLGGQCLSLTRLCYGDLACPHCGGRLRLI